MHTIRPIPYKATWPIRHEVMWPDQPYDFIKLPRDPEGQHYGLFVAEKLISIVSVYTDANEAQFRKFATLEVHQGKGYGTALLEFLMQKLEDEGFSRIWCNARKDKASYYERFGLKETDQTYEKGGIDFVIMAKERRSEMH